MWETGFEKSDIFNGFINDISKSRDRGLYFRKSEEGDMGIFLMKGGPLNLGGGVEIFCGVDTMDDTRVLINAKFWGHHLINEDKRSDF